MAKKVIVILLFALITVTVTHSTGDESEEKEKKRVFADPTPCAADMPNAADNNCLSCHEGIQPIRCTNSKMFKDIVASSEKSGVGNHCIVCHGGNPSIRREGIIAVGSEAFEALADKAHKGSPYVIGNHVGPAAFYPDPGSPWINDRTCGSCHARHVAAQWRSLMMTESGKIQGTAWGFGALTGYQHKWANYPVKNAPPEARQGEKDYRQYLADLAQKEPQVFPEAMAGLPRAPRGDADIEKNPQKAAFTYLRGECQRCHLGVGGKQRYGDFRGLGCSACHMPYSNGGLYEGYDPSIPKDKPGHILVHRMQSTHDAPVTNREVTYSGIPVETCTTCHNRGRRIGVSFQGLMESAFPSPWQEDGAPQMELHGKNYIKLKADLHSGKGFVCQDCHTSFDVHSSNHLIGAITATVEIECSDCHGTASHYPWELPLGHGDEYAETQKSGPGRGVAKQYPKYLEDGKAPESKGDFLKTARGNVMENAVKQGDKVRLFLASGEVKDLTPLKGMVEKEKLSLKGQVAMAEVEGHLERMECYTCHSTWAPQCYGCHLKVDYSSKKQHYDWVSLGENHLKNGMTGEYTGAGELYRIDGEIVETRSYLRWEDPALAQNGEGRISPVIPGCQTTVTLVGKDGKPVVKNLIFRVKDAEGKGSPGQLAIDMAPLHPHTVQKEARECASCHDSPKALGYGIAAGANLDRQDKAHTVDLMSGDGKLIPRKTEPLVTPIDGLSMDWSRFVTEKGEQLQTVGHHLNLSRPLNDEERSHMDRRGTCLACHREIPDQSLAVGLLHHIAEIADLLPETTEAHSGLVNKILLSSGWLQFSAIVCPILILIGAALYLRKRRRARNGGAPRPPVPPVPSSSRPY
jgi:hypothetical protein